MHRFSSFVKELLSYQHLIILFTSTRFFYKKPDYKQPSTRHAKIKKFLELLQKS